MSPYCTYAKDPVSLAIDDTLKLFNSKLHMVYFRGCRALSPT